MDSPGTMEVEAPKISHLERSPSPTNRDELPEVSHVEALTTREKEFLMPKVERTSAIEPPTPQPERTQPCTSRRVLHHNSRGAHWTLHIERRCSAANRDEPHITRRDEIAHHH